MTTKTTSIIDEVEATRDRNLEYRINKLIRKYGDEWDFMMGSRYKKEKAKNVPGSPRRVYWATMSTYVLYKGGFNQTAGRDEGYLKIISAEKHHSFRNAIASLEAQMENFVNEVV